MTERALRRELRHWKANHRDVVRRKQVAQRLLRQALTDNRRLRERLGWADAARKDN